MPTRPMAMTSEVKGYMAMTLEPTEEPKVR